MVGEGESADEERNVRLLRRDDRVDLSSKATTVS